MAVDKYEQFRNNVSNKLHTNREILRIFFAEFLGTLFLVALGDGAVAQFVFSNVNANDNDRNETFLTVNFAYAFAIAFGVYICGGVSGGHINPAVTLTMCVFGRCEFLKLPVYWAGQFLGAFFGSAVIFTTYYDAFDDFDRKKRSKNILEFKDYCPKFNESCWSFDQCYNDTKFCNPTKVMNRKFENVHLYTVNNTNWVVDSMSIFGTLPGAHLSVFGGFYDQFIGTAILLLCVFAITDQRNMNVPKHFVPLLVGLVVGVIGMSYGYNCGYAINPARDLAPRLFTLIAGWGTATFPLKFFWAPIIGPFLGALFGALIYQALIGIHWPTTYEVVKVIDEPRGTIIETVITDPKGKVVSSPL